MTYGPSIIPTIHFEPPKEENLSTKDMTYGPSIIPAIHFEPLKELEDNLALYVQRPIANQLIFVVPKVSYI